MLVALVIREHKLSRRSCHGGVILLPGLLRSCVIFYFNKTPDDGHLQRSENYILTHAKEQIMINAMKAESYELMKTCWPDYWPDFSISQRRPPVLIERQVASKLCWSRCRNLLLQNFLPTLLYCVKYYNYKSGDFVNRAWFLWLRVLLRVRWSSALDARSVSLLVVPQS